MAAQVSMSGTGGTSSEGDPVVRYSVPQMARYLGISERAVRKQIEAGKLFAVKEDRAWVVIVDRSAVPDSAQGGTAPKRGATPVGTPITNRAVSRNTYRAAGTAGSEAGTVPTEPDTARSVVDDNMGPHDELLTVEHAEPRGTDRVQEAVPDAEPAVSSGSATAPVPPVDLSPLVDLVAELTRKNADLTEAATVWQFRARHLEEQLKQLTAGDSAETETARVEAPVARPEAFGSTPAPDAPQSSQGSTARSWWRRLIGG